MQRRETFTVRGLSMQGRAEPGDTLAAQYGIYACRPPVRGDLVLLDKSGQHLVKQLLVLPGDRLAVTGSVLMVNDKPLEVLAGQPLVLDLRSRALLALNEGVVPPDAFMVFSTRATDGFDSRRFSFVGARELVARLDPP